MTTIKSCSAPPSTLRSVAEELGVHRTTLENWRHEGCPGLPPGRVNLNAVKRWAAREGKRAEVLAGPLSGSLRGRLLAEQIRKLTLANDVMEGILIDVLFVAGRIYAHGAKLDAIRIASEQNDPLLFAAAVGNEHAKRDIIRRIWNEIEAATGDFQAEFPIKKGPVA